jgi:glycosyltransferase involved in cell wall biosynthesis
MIHLVLRSPDAYQRALCRALHHHYQGEFVAWFQSADQFGALALEGESFKFRLLSECRYRRLFRELKMDHAAIVILGGWSSRIAYQTILISKFLGAPLFVWADHPHPRQRSWPIEYPRRLYLRMLASIVDGFLACGQPTVNHLEKRLGIPNKITNFPYWIDIPEEWSLPAHCTNDQQAVRLIAIGRHVPVKAFEVAIEAIHLSNQAAGRCIATLDLVGDGPERARLEALSESLGTEVSATFRGWRNNEEVWELVKSADALVIPSRFEPYGVVVLEALASGRPVLASNQVVGAVDKDDGSGAIRFHEVGDSKQLAQQISLLANRPDVLLKSAQAARAIALNWPLELAAEILQTAIDKAIHPKSSRGRQRLQALDEMVGNSEEAKSQTL